MSDVIRGRPVAVIGCGYLGGRIALELALLGHEVNVFDRRMCHEDIRQHMSSFRSEFVAACRHVDPAVEEIQSQFTEAVDRIHGFDCLTQAVQGCFLVSEAVVERLEVKVSVFREALEHCPPDAYLTTNSLTIPIGVLQESVQAPQRLYGLRFLAPVLFIPYAEVSYLERQRSQVRGLLDLVQGALRKSCFQSILRARDEPIARTAARSPLLSKLRLDMKSVRLHQHREAKARSMGFESCPEEECCVICLAESPTVLSVSCGHKALCGPCAEMLLELQDPCCPLCRERFRCQLVAT